ncbi:MAG: hypothetical protein A2289_15345 [Deltaproteobacteria bacterium RIFOXYA12_FULL_58_15]|nr:MAG: hypothetical protein A2289_15345 [Deltaproteobacteria bacterium RIFOXYA12_FULL_58_15]OGR13132.1 MAG: hypothetical protein A2341_08520 [Deltaproteobacteria bacterium RIFOXYB12_FULL_58_9]
MEPQRRSRRVNVNLFIGDVTSKDDWRVPTVEGTPLGVTRDWNETGVFIETNARPAIGTIVEISFVWGDESVRSRARVIRHATDGIGLEFVEPPGEFTVTVGSILASEE